MVFDYTTKTHPSGDLLLPDLLRAVRPSLSALIVRGSPAQTAMHKLYTTGYLPRPPTWTFIPINIVATSSPFVRVATNFIPDSRMPKPVSHLFARQARDEHCAARNGNYMLYACLLYTSPSPRDS